MKIVTLKFGRDEYVFNQVESVIFAHLLKQIPDPNLSAKDILVRYRIVKIEQQKYAAKQQATVEVPEIDCAEQIINFTYKDSKSWNLVDEFFINKYFIKCKDTSVVYVKSDYSLTPIKCTTYGYKAYDIISAIGPKINEFQEDFNKVLSKVSEFANSEILPLLQSPEIEAKFAASAKIKDCFEHYFPRSIAGEINLVSMVTKIGEIVNHKQVVLLPKNRLFREIKCETYLETLVTLCSTYDISSIKSEPKIFSSDLNEYAIHHFNAASLYEKGSCPTWQKFFDGKCSKDELKKYMWFWASVLDPNNSSRQALFIYDAQGRSGKGVLSDLMERLLGSDLVQSVNGASTFSNNFWGSKVFGKRYLSIADNANTNIMKTQWFKQLVSGDSIDVEFKGKDAFNYQPNIRICVSSNHITEVLKETSSLSRILPITFKANYTADTMMDRKTLVDLMWSEIKAWNFQCKQVYESVTTIGGNYPISDKEILESIATSFDETSDLVLNFLFELIENQNTSDKIKILNSDISSFLNINQEKITMIDFKKEIFKFLNEQNISYIKDKVFRIDNKTIRGIQVFTKIEEIKNKLNTFLGDIEEIDSNPDGFFIEQPKKQSSFKSEVNWE